MEELTRTRWRFSLRIWMWMKMWMWMWMRSNNGQVVTNSQPTDTRGWLHCKKKYRPPVKELLINYLTVQQKNMFSYFVKIISIGINISKKIQL